MALLASTRSGLAVVALYAVLLTACGGSGSADTGSGRIDIVASTDVWGDIASHIAGSKADVTSLITNPDADPHSYEANVKNQLQVSKAEIIIENGGGYDDFVDTMRKSSDSRAKVLNAVDISGKKPVNGTLNEHVWYDFPSVQKVVTQLAAALIAADPADESTFTANAAAFSTRLTALEATEATVRKVAGGKGVAITEPVPLYLTAACGLVNKTPAAFSEAVEEGTDVSPLVLKQTLALFSDRAVSVLAYNEQTTGIATDRVLAAAKANHVAIVPVTETLPADQDYLQWMSANLAAIQRAVA